MKKKSKIFRKSFFFDSTLCFLTAQFLAGAPAWSFLAASPNLSSILSSPDNTDSTYTINFKNIAIIEYIRFVSRITGLNFIFNDQELLFTVSIVSEEPVSQKNVVSALIQILQINGLTVAEQDQNLVISRSNSLPQIAQVVNGVSSLPNMGPIITRIFHVNNTSLANVSSIIRSMASKSAIIEISQETRQLIVTDSTSNIDKIADLLQALDTPHSPLQILSYTVKNVSAADLNTTLLELITPFRETNIFLSVPQAERNKMLLVSTPYLLQKAQEILQQLDVPYSSNPIGSSGQSIYLYEPINLKAEDLLFSLEDLAKNLKANGPATAGIIAMLKSANLSTEDSNTIVFVGDATNWLKVQQLLASVDNPTSKGKVVWIYDIQNTSFEGIQSALEETAEKIEKSGAADTEQLVDAIDHMHYISTTDSILFTGSPQAVARLKELLPKMDVSTSSKSYFIYTPKYASADALKKLLVTTLSSLHSSGFHDSALADAINNSKVDTHQNVITFSGRPEVLAQVKKLIVDIDSGKQNASSILLYKPKYVSEASMKHALNQIMDSLEPSMEDSSTLSKALKGVEWVGDSHAFLFRGDPETLARVKEILQDIDNPDNATDGEPNFRLYRLQNAPGDLIESQLKSMANQLPSDTAQARAVIHAIDEIKWISDNNSLLISGSKQTIEQVVALIEKFDLTSADKNDFFLYTTRFLAPEAIEATLKEYATTLQQSGLSDPGLLTSIQSAKILSSKNQIAFTGSPPTLEKIKNLLVGIDVSAVKESDKDAETALGSSNYEIYTPHYQDPKELISRLCEFTSTLQESGVQDQGLFDTVDNIKVIAKSGALIISGPEESIQRIKDLLARFDIPGGDGSLSGKAGFMVYKLQYHTGDIIQQSLKKLAPSLDASGPNPNAALAMAIDTMQWIQATNSLLASGEAETLDKLRDLISQIDVALRQVFIEVLVIETDVLNSQDFGLEWAGKAQYLDKLAIAGSNYGTGTSNDLGGVTPFHNSMNNVGATTTPNPGMIPGGNPGFDLGVIGDLIWHKGSSFVSLGSLVNALQRDTDSTIVMNPKIVGQDTKNSTIFVGQNIPYVGSFVQNNVTSTSTLSTSNIEYKDVGSNLSITPNLGNDDIVTLDITYTMSAQTVNTAVNGDVSPGIQGVQTTQTNMTTRVHVPDQHFVVLSGMLQNTKQFSKTGIPCLGGLPVIGLAFSDNLRSDTRSNIIIFIRPQIINSFSDFKKITEVQEDLYREQAVKKTIKEFIDEGINMVKTPENE